MSHNIPNSVQIGVLATVLGINLKNTGQTTLYTVPSGKTLIITDILLIPTTANTITIPPIIRIGKASNYNEWAPLVTLTGLNAANQLFSLATAATGLIRQTFAAGEVVKLDVQTGATATSLTITTYLFGFLI